MPKLNYVPPQKCTEDPPEKVCSPKTERLEVKSVQEQEEMDFSRIVELNEQLPDLEPIDWGQKCLFMHFKHMQG